MFNFFVSEFISVEKCGAYYTGKLFLIPEISLVVEGNILNGSDNSKQNVQLGSEGKCSFVQFGRDYSQLLCFLLMFPGYLE